MTALGLSKPGASSQHHQPVAHYDQNQKEVRTGDQGSQRRPLRGLRPTPIENTGPSDRNHRNRQLSICRSGGLSLLMFAVCQSRRADSSAARASGQIPVSRSQSGNEPKQH